NLLPVLKRELTLDKLYLLRFHARASMRRDGTLNFEDLIQSSSSGNPEPPPGTAEKKSWFTFGVDHLSVVEARVDFHDVSQEPPFATTVGPLTFQLERFRTRADAKSPYSFIGTTESGERFSWSGMLRTEPLRSNGTIAFENLRIPKYRPYYRRQLTTSVMRSGVVSLRTRYDVEWGPQRRYLRLSEGEVAVRHFAATLQGDEQPIFQLEAMDVAGISVEPLESTAEISSVTLRGMLLRARRKHDGQLNLTRLVPPAAPSETSSRTSTKAPFRWAVRRVELSNGRVEFEDAAPNPPVRVVLAPIEARVENLASAPRTTSTFQLSSNWNETGRVNVSGTAALQ